jgi:hypothetical protein
VHQVVTRVPLNHLLRLTTWAAFHDRTAGGGALVPPTPAAARNTATARNTAAGDRAAAAKPTSAGANRGSPAAEQLERVEPGGAGDDFEEVVAALVGMDSYLAVERLQRNGAEGQVYCRLCHATMDSRGRRVAGELCNCYTVIHLWICLGYFHTIIHMESRDRRVACGL